MNARQVALDVLSSVVKDKTYLNLALKSALRQSLSPEDKRFCTALASTTVENLSRIDYIIDQFVKGQRVHAVIRNILRLGVCQLIFFESVPASAAVNESVKLAEKNGKAKLKGFVNATLRNIERNLGNIPYPDASKNFLYYLHIMYSYPLWLCEKYVRDYGAAQAESMIAYKGGPAKTCVRLNLSKRKEAPEGSETGLYCGDAFYLRNAASIETMPMFQKGEIAVMGEASMLCVRAAGVGARGRVLDLCAAPGGKSAYAAQFAHDGSVTALDLYPHRVELIAKTAARLGIPNIKPGVADATVFDPSFTQRFDVVLADAPCSALGLLYRKPDIKLFKQEEDIPELVKIQRAILSNGADYVKPGGVLLYSTCTVNRQENEENATWFLEKHPEFVPDELESHLPEPLARRAEGGMIQLLPHIDHIDGFFIARFKKQ